MAATPLRIPKSAEVLAGHIRNQIVRGELHEGDSLPNETDLMARFQVSRHVLREAYRILESERLITVRRGAKGGAQVLAPDPAVAARHVGILLQVRGTTLTDLEDARVAIEPLAVRRLAESPNLDEATAELRVYNERAAAKVEDLTAFSGLSFAFHKKVVELANNQTLALMMELISDIIERHISFRQLSTRTSRDELVHANRLSVRANEKLIKLLENGDAEEAEAYWRRHVAAVGRHLASTEGPLTVVDLMT